MAATATHGHYDTYGSGIVAVNFFRFWRDIGHRWIVTEWQGRGARRFNAVGLAVATLSAFVPGSGFGVFSIGSVLGCCRGTGCWAWSWLGRSLVHQSPIYSFWRGYWEPQTFQH
jgi:hypothetical protein